MGQRELHRRNAVHDLLNLRASEVPGHAERREVLAVADRDAVALPALERLDPRQYLSSTASGRSSVIGAAAVGNVHSSHRKRV